MRVKNPLGTLLIHHQKGKNMIKNIFCLAMVVLASYFFIGPAQATEANPHGKHMVENHSEFHLSHDLKVVLNQEMNGIQEGMMKIIPAIAAGDWETIAAIAKNINDSFILKQKLTKQQIEELHHTLPAGFIEIDQKFHSTANKLAHSAHQQDAELVNFYFYKLHNQCTQCHSKYAAERFPSLKPNTGGHH